MKRKFFIALLICLLSAVLALALAACVYDPGKVNGGDHGSNEFEQGSYTVRFNSNSPTSYAPQTVKWGEKLQEPDPPVKVGYKFLYWSKDGTNPYDFAIERVEAAFTLTAMYEPIKYTHTVDLTKKLVYDASSGEFSLQEADYSFASMAEGAEVYSTYYIRNAQMAVPTVDPETANGDKFCFWFYMEEQTDEQDVTRTVPVRLTEIKQDEQAYVGELSRYEDIAPKKIYAMFESALPKVTVKLLDRDGSSLGDQLELPFTKNIKDGDVGVPVKSGYDFAYWYFKQEVEDEEGNQTFNNVEFVLEKVRTDDSGQEVISVKGTSPMSAAGAEDYFVPVTLELYAKWRAIKEISSVNDFSQLHSAIRNAEGDELQELLDAHIIIKANIDFGAQEFEPLYADPNAPFTGTIDCPEGERHTISNGTFKGYANSSVFGYVAGSVTGIDFENVKLALYADGDGNLQINGEDGFAKTAEMGVIASVLSGSVKDCHVTLTAATLENYRARILFGGIAGALRGPKGETAEIADCDVNITLQSLSVQAAYIGGIVGQTNAAALIQDNCVATVHIVQITLPEGYEDGGVRLGAVVGVNSGIIRYATATLTVDAFNRQGELLAGGITGFNEGTVAISSATANITAAVFGDTGHTVCVGGLVGRNWGVVNNSYAKANIALSVPTSNEYGNIVAAGGLIGDNFSNFNVDSSTAGVVRYSYAEGSVAVNVEQGITTTTVYAGGLLGRNSHNVVVSCFALVNVSVQNDNADKAHIGYIVGSLEKGANISSVWYCKDCTLTLNGTQHEVINEGDENGDGYEENFDTVRAGTMHERAEFTDEGTLFKTDGFNFNRDGVWEILGEEGAKQLPTLKPAATGTQG